MRACRIALVGALTVVTMAARAAGAEDVANISFPSGLTQPVALPFPHGRTEAEGFFLLHPGETLANWTELAGVIIRPAAAASLFANTPQSPPAYGPEQHCTVPAARMVVLSDTRQIVRTEASHCASSLDITQIAQAIRGKASRWEFFYAIRGKPLAPAREAEVMRAFQAVRYVP